MLRKLIHFFKQPFPYFRKKWQFVILIVLCVATVLTIVSSFFIDELTLGLFIMFVGGYTAISALCSLMVICLLPKLFYRFFDEKRWSKGKYFVLSFILTLIIGTGNSLYGFYLGDVVSQTGNSFSFYLYVHLLSASLVGIIPATAGYFWIKYRALHSELQEKEDQNQKLIVRVRENGVSKEKLVTLSGNTKDALTVFPEELLYIESSSNYVHIFYKINDRISQKTLRATLQQMEEQLCDYPYFVRCHRAFIVNINQIEKAKGFRLWLFSIEKVIPVSKSCKNNLQKQLKTVGYLSQI